MDNSKQRGTVYNARYADGLVAQIVETEQYMYQQKDVKKEKQRACSSDGRAPALHAGGTGIDTWLVHILRIVLCRRRFPVGGGGRSYGLVRVLVRTDVPHFVRPAAREPAGSALIISACCG